MQRITSLDNPRFKHLLSLARNGKARRHSRETLIEGLHLIQVYTAQINASYDLIVSEQALTNPNIDAWLKNGQSSGECVLLPEKLFNKLAHAETPTGLMARIKTPLPPSLDMAQAAVSIAHAQEDCLLLDGVQDPGNIGTILRTAAAAGVRHVLLSPQCAQPWSPKVLRAGQGAHFLLRIYEAADLTAFLAVFPGDHIVTSVTDDAPSLYEACWRHPAAWVFGSEGQGVGSALLESASLRVKIPMMKHMPSLNVGVAVAVCLFESRRRRS